MSTIYEPSPDPDDIVPTGDESLSPYWPAKYVKPEDRLNPIELTIAGEDYPGTLTNTWTDRLTRIQKITTMAMRLLLGFLGGIDFTVNIVINLPNPFNRDNWPGPKTVNKKGFQALVEMIELLHRKVDNLHEDLLLIEPVASVVEHWQLKKEALRPQCIFLFGDYEQGADSIGAPKWQTCVPHFDFSLAPTFTNEWGYWKGPFQGILTLDDNSKVIVYARDKQEIERLFDRYLEGIPADLQMEAYTKIGEYKGPPFSSRFVRLRRVDYYVDGRLKGPPTDYLRYPRDVN